jgi:hypothetical protein
VSIALLNAFTPGKLGPLRAFASRFLPKPRPAGEKAPSRVPLIAGTAAAVALTAVLGHEDPHAVLTVAREFEDALVPFRLAGGVARNHLLLESVLLAAGGGWYVRSSRK